MVQIWDFSSNFKTGFFLLKVAAIQWEEHHHPWPVLKELRLFLFRRMMSSQSLKNQRSSPRSDNQTKSLLIPVIGTQENQSSLSRCVKPCYTKYPTYYLLNPNHVPLLRTRVCSWSKRWSHNLILVVFLSTIVLFFTTKIWVDRASRLASDHSSSFKSGLSYVQSSTRPFCAKEPFLVILTYLCFN